MVIIIIFVVIVFAPSYGVSILVPRSNRVPEILYSSFRDIYFILMKFFVSVFLSMCAHYKMVVCIV